jgi:hypothetical protein
MRKLVWNCSILFEIDAVWRHLDADRDANSGTPPANTTGTTLVNFAKRTQFEVQMRRDAPTTSSSHSIDEYEAG